MWGPPRVLSSTIKPTLSSEVTQISRCKVGVCEAPLAPMEGGGGVCIQRSGLVIPLPPGQKQIVHSLVDLYLVQNLCQLCDLSSQNQVTQDLTQELLEIKSLGQFHLSRL